jgi:hypothetical protein
MVHRTRAVHVVSTLREEEDMTMRRRVLFAIVQGCLVYGAHVKAQTTEAPATPEATVGALLEALKSERWRDAATFLDLGLFESHFRETIAFARSERRRSPGLTVEEMLRQDPNMPRAVAEYFVKQSNEHTARMGDPVLEQYAGVPSIDSLSRLSTLDAAARRLEGMDPQHMYRRMRAASGCPPDSSDEKDFARMFPPLTVLGSVNRGDLTYILIGDSIVATDVTKAIADHRPPNVIRAVRWGNRWRVRDWEILHGTIGFTVACEPIR